MIYLLVMAGVAAASFLAPMPITVNGERTVARFNATVEEAIAASSANPKPGNLVAVDGDIIERGAGEPFVATVNGDPIDDITAPVSVNSEIEVSNGNDVVEPFKLIEETTEPGATVDGVGAVHLISQPAQTGIKAKKIGEISKVEIVEDSQHPVDAICTRTNIDTGGEPVIALTFDDGPNSEYTPQILDILAANGASATFFTLGNRITGDNVGVVQRAAAEGHQIATHTFDHASGSGQGVNLGYMTPEEQIAEVQNGWNAIVDTIGIQPSKYIRVPGGNFGDNVIVNLSPIIAGDIGWNIDTRDWERPGVESIKAQILSASPGDIVLMHDGGGDRSQTAQALAEALPELVARGYRFVTVDELLKYLPQQ